ncbi:3-hydroxyacyl-CoA dehydrogenase family protein [Amycolatopsis alkalitolerans]|uniref:3-hydroxyacyl-CoA dehydrogenase family protein n=1 Tax=Amycolatopsis alkalitolerans TaxID=2547244 RepID=A0A5C4MAY0_9PSEU|nr:3-hydroxyacyl-CoA dehydrogenase family protein [Amycolatopsis alkalitolerans]TNC29460.1 3-hydroxyacyl-CoA dehydrogenase family protein [Amycolatopsis alkalitolerans]
MSDIKRVAVLGLGTMGSGIAQVTAMTGHEVTVLETSQERIDAGLAALRAFLDGGVERGKLTETKRDETLARIRPVTQTAELAGSDLVIEAVTERAEVKRALFRAVAEVVAGDALIVTNTSALPVTDLAASVPHPARFAGLHFFNPAPLMKVVEVVRALQTGADVVERLAAFVGELGKEPVVVKDRPGFLVNYLLMPYLNDVIAEYDRDLATAEDLDTAMRLGLGYKLGPLELLDLIGLDVHNHATQSAYDATLDPRFAPPPLLRQMVAAGFHGKKTGQGFRTGQEKAS